MGTVATIDAETPVVFPRLPGDQQCHSPHRLSDRVYIECGVVLFVLSLSTCDTAEWRALCFLWQ